MSGHNRWSQIKHKKGASDAKKGKIFSRLGRAISIAARDNPDPSSNTRLKTEIERARAVNMPNENIERAIKRVSDKSANTLTEIQLELIGPAGTAIIVTAITDNSNRTINELKQIVTKLGARMAGQGSVVWMFKKSGVIRLKEANDDLALKAIDIGADDVQTEGGQMIVYSAPEKTDMIKSALGEIVESSSVDLIPTTPCPIGDPAEQSALEKILDALDEHDDVQDIYTNADY